MVHIDENYSYDHKHKSIVESIDHNDKLFELNYYNDRLLEYHNMMVNRILIDEDKYDENQLVNDRLTRRDMIENNHLLNNDLRRMYFVKIMIDSLNTLYYT